MKFAAFFILTIDFIALRALALPSNGTRDEMSVAVMDPRKFNPHKHPVGNDFEACREVGHDVYCCEYGIDWSGHVIKNNGDQVGEEACRRTTIKKPCKEQANGDIPHGPYCCNTANDGTMSRKAFLCAGVGLD